MEDLKAKRELLKTFSPQKKPDLELEIYTMTEEDYDDIGKKAAKIFAEMEPVCYGTETGVDGIYKDIHLPILKKSVKDKLAIVARNKATKEFVATIWSEDFLELDPLPEDCHENNVEVLHFLEYLENKAFETLEKPKEKYEMIHVVIVCLNLDYSGLDITTEMTNYLLFEHPLSKNSKIFFTEATNKRSARMFEKAGFKTLFTCNYADLDSKKFKTVSQCGKKFEKDYGFNYGHALEFMTWERK